MSTTLNTLSCNVVQESRVDGSGLSSIYFRMIEGRQKKDFATGIRWPRSHFDKSSQQLFARYKGDPDVIPFNTKLNDLKSKAHKLLYHEWARGNPVSLTEMVKLFTDRSNTEDFLEFMLNKAKGLYNDDIIVYGIST